MQRYTYALRRTRARSAIVAVLLLMATLVTAALAGTVTYLDTASAAAVRTVLADAGGARSTATVQTRLDGDGVDQDTAARAVIAAELPDDALVWRTLRTVGVPVASGATSDGTGADADPAGGSEATLVLGVDESITDFADLTEGAWPTEPTEAALQADAAEVLGLEVGDVIGLGVEDAQASLTLVGTWRATDPEHPHWSGEALAAGGTDPITGEFGPLIVTTPALDQLGSVPHVRWTITPPPTVTDADLPGWRTGLAGLEQAMNDAGVDVRGLTVTGGLASTLDDAASGLAAVDAATTIPLVIVALVSLVAVWQIARLLAALRERETRVLRSRGAANDQMIRMSAAEAALLAVPGAALGAVIVLLSFGPRAGARPLAIVAIAAAVALVTALILTGVGTIAALRGLRPTSESGRSSTIMAGGALVLVVLAAAFTLWRFTLNGSPLVPGTAVPDPLAVVGPALGLLAVALIAVALAGPVTAWLASRAARGRSYSPAMPLRQTARRIALNAVPVILVVLATAITTLAAGYAGTWTQLRTMSAQVGNGADVRVTYDSRVAGASPRGVNSYVDLPDVVGATGVLQTSMRQEELDGQLTVMPAADLGVGSAPSTVLDPAAVADLLGADPDVLSGPEVPAGAAELSLTTTVAARSSDLSDRPSRQVQFALWLFDGVELVRLQSDVTIARAEGAFEFNEENQSAQIVTVPGQGDPVTTTTTLVVPAGSWRLVAVDAVIDSGWVVTDYDLAVDSLTAEGIDLLADVGADWTPDTLPLADPTSTITPGDDGVLSASVLSIGPEIGFAGRTQRAEPVRFMPAVTERPTLPVVTTPTWEGLILPGGTDVLVNGVTVRMEAAGEVAVVPGNSNPAAALADLPTFTGLMLRSTENVPAITEIWMDAEPGAAAEVATAAGAVADARAEVQLGSDGSADPIAAPARTVYWVAAVCALLLAIPAVAAVALTQAAARRGEVVVLRAVGVGSGQQARSRRQELLGLELGAVLAGIAAGVGVSWLVMVDLVRSTTPQISEAVPLGLRFDLPLGLALLGVIVATVAGVAFWYGRRVRAQALDTTWREEIR
ncbi:ABC transporter permease [Occultella glacieicola]|uniref:ABC transporter permease n=1 Tax=Occultella glacieicola TaxID=2518684 RepID=A0ABY2E969_9MICO|nr:FtsX-like permease family protein [Occultella glacieicola]TDE95820.1 ABC transporter permease [Occultella glacieicola]